MIRMFLFITAIFTYSAIGLIAYSQNSAATATAAETNVTVIEKTSDTSIVDLGDALVVPGFVNSHAHLELSALQGKLPRNVAFPSWIGALLMERGKLSLDDLRTGYARGAGSLLRSGCTLVGDIDDLADSFRNRQIDALWASLH